MDQFIRPSKALFEIKNLCHFYGDKAALRNVLLQKSEVLALLGPSGSGKSTLRASITGMITPRVAPRRT